MRDYEAQRQAQIRRWAKPESRASHCSRGHEWTPENTAVSPSQTRTNGRSGRRCRQCDRDRKRELYYQRKNQS